MTNDEIGRRVRESLGGATQYEVATAVGMTPDAFSRSVNGQRAFSSVELAAIADALDVSVYWLVTGKPDPANTRVAARHLYDRDSHTRSVPDFERDRETLESVVLAYAQAYPDGNPNAGSWSVPDNPADLRRILGDSFVLPFIERIEGRLGVDVVRLPELSHNYSMVTSDFAVIAIRATGNWFYENFSLAHELGHLSAGELDGEGTTADEASANAFAAELLLPEDCLRKMDWDVAPEEVADRLWRWGVSCDTLANRIDYLELGLPSSIMDKLRSLTTQGFLRRYWHAPENPGGEPVDRITERMEQAAARRFPHHLEVAHVARITDGRVGSKTLAWILGVREATLGLESTQPRPVDDQVLAQALGLE